MVNLSVCYLINTVRLLKTEKRVASVEQNVKMFMTGKRGGVVRITTEIYSTVMGLVLSYFMYSNCLLTYAFE